jgi:NADP-dependent 3-hydroxy acid dehydrogenase YdfG
MRGAAEELKNKVKQIDVLVHNGGCMLHDRLYTKAKIEKNFATNTLAVYYLTVLCLDLLHANSRTIAVSSGGCLTQKLATEDVFMEQEDYDGTTQYARNKRQQLCVME